MPLEQYCCDRNFGSNRELMRECKGDNLSKRKLQVDPMGEGAVIQKDEADIFENGHSIDPRHSEAGDDGSVVKEAAAPHEMTDSAVLIYSMEGGN